MTVYEQVHALTKINEPDLRTIERKLICYNKLKGYPPPTEQQYKKVCLAIHSKTERTGLLLSTTIAIHFPEEGSKSNCGRKIGPGFLMTHLDFEGKHINNRYTAQHT